MRPLIIEGPDLVGKSTFAEKLSKYVYSQCGCAPLVAHMTKPEHQFDYYDTFLDKLTDDLIYDRYHVGGYVYGHVLGLHSWNSNVDRQRLLCQEMHDQAKPLVLLLMHDSYESLEEKWARAARDEMFDIHSVHQANLVYRSLAMADTELQKSIVGHDVMAFQFGGDDYPDNRHMSRVLDRLQC